MRFLKRRQAASSPSPQVRYVGPITLGVGDVVSITARQRRPNGTFAKPQVLGSYIAAASDVGRTIDLLVITPRTSELGVDDAIEFVAGRRFQD